MDRIERTYDDAVTVTDERIDSDEAEFADAAGVLNVANARLVQLAEQVLLNESWVGSGVHSPTQWLTYRTGVSPAVTSPRATVRPTVWP